MKPIRTDESNFTYHLDDGTEANDLPCVRTEDPDSVKSTWAIESSDLEALSPDFPRVVLDVVWPVPVRCSIQIGDGETHTSPQSGGVLERESIEETLWLYWRYTHILGDRELQVLNDGARISVIVGMIPPPPVALQLA